MERKMVLTSLILVLSIMGCEQQNVKNYSEEPISQTEKKAPQTNQSPPKKVEVTIQLKDSQDNPISKAPIAIDAKDAAILPDQNGRRTFLFEVGSKHTITVGFGKEVKKEIIVPAHPIIVEFIKHD